MSKPTTRSRATREKKSVLPVVTKLKPGSSRRPRKASLRSLQRALAHMPPSRRGRPSKLQKALMR